MNIPRALLVWPLIASTLSGAPGGARAGYHVYVGTYTGEKSRGIYVARFQPADGRLGALDLAAETVNPSFLAVHPNGQFLYAVNETGAGSVSAFAIDARTGRLAFLNQVSSRGAGPCHLAVDAAGRYVLAANYGGGSVAVFPIRGDGHLGDASAFVQHTGSSMDARQKAAHAHWIGVSPGRRFVVAADLGLDQVLIYRWDSARGALEPNQPPFARVRPGAGPRHFAFHPAGRFAYVINELASSLTAFAWDEPSGTLGELHTISTLPSEFRGDNSGAELAVDRRGRFLYASNRGHDSIAVFAIDARRGTLTALGQTPTGGRTPRSFALDPTGRYLFAANQRSDRVVLLRINPQTGRLAPAGQTLEVGSPVSIVFVPARR